MSSGCQEALRQCTVITALETCGGSSRELTLSAPSLCDSDPVLLYVLAHKFPLYRHVHSHVCTYTYTTGRWNQTDPARWLSPSLRGYLIQGPFPG